MPLSRSSWISWMFWKVCLKHHDTSLNDIHIWQQAFPDQKGNENTSVTENVYTLLCFLTPGKTPFFVKKNLKERTWSKCTSVLWILLLDVVQIIQEKSNANPPRPEKSNFECVFERHMQRLKSTFRNHHKRKMFQKDFRKKIIPKEQEISLRQRWSWQLKCPLDWEHPPHSTSLERNYLISLWKKFLYWSNNTVLSDSHFQFKSMHFFLF